MSTCLQSRCSLGLAGRSSRVARVMRGCGTRRKCARSAARRGETMVFPRPASAPRSALKSIGITRLCGTGPGLARARLQATRPATPRSPSTSTTTPRWTTRSFRRWSGRSTRASRPERQSRAKVWAEAVKAYNRKWLTEWFEEQGELLDAAMPNPGVVPDLGLDLPV